MKPPQSDPHVQICIRISTWGGFKHTPITRSIGGARSPPRPLPSAGALFDEMPRRSQGALRNGSCFRITFFIGPEVSVHFFKALEADLSQQEVYQFNVPTFGPDVIFDVNYSMRQEQPRFFTEALRIAKLRSYVDRMVLEAQPSYFLRTTNQTDVVSARELRMLEVLLCELVLGG